MKPTGATGAKPLGRFGRLHAADRNPLFPEITNHDERHSGS